MVTIPAQKLSDFVASVFSHAGSSDAEAHRIANYLVTANLTGHDSHGVIRVPQYVRWKNEGSIVPDQTIKLLVDTPSLAVVDGGFGYGQTVAPQAVAVGIEKCKANGLAAVTLRNSEGSARTVALDVFNAEVEGRPAPSRPAEEDTYDNSEEISPELMYTSEFAIPEPRLVILTETLETETPAPAAPQRPERRRRGKRGASGGGAGGGGGGGSPETGKSPGAGDGGPAKGS